MNGVGGERRERASAVRSSVSIVIPSYNTWWLLARCLASLERNGVAGQQVIVVDDGSSDESRAQLAQTRGIDVAFTAHNRGFAGACNLGAAIARADTLLFLNADTEALPGAIAAMLDALDDPTVGIVGAKLLYPEGGIQHGGLILDRDLLFAHAHWMRPDELSDSEVPRDYPVVTGAAFALRAREFRALGCFDEAFVNGYEDAELCMRTWASGRRVLYEPRARFLHVESASPDRFAKYEANHARFAERWHNVIAALPRVPAAEDGKFKIEGALDAAGAVGDESRRLLKLLSVVEMPMRRTVEGVEAAFGLRILQPGAEPAAFVAPANDDEAKRLVEDLDVRRFLVPTWRAFGRMLRAGVALERVDMLRAGIDAEKRGPREGGLIVTYVSEVTTVLGLRLALQTWSAARATLEPIGARIEIRVTLADEPLQSLLVQAVERTGIAPHELTIHRIAGDATADDVLDGASTLLLTGPTDRVDRIPLLAFASGVDVVALGRDEPDLRVLVGDEAYLSCDDPSELPMLLCTSFGSGRDARVALAQRDIARRHSQGKAYNRFNTLVRRRDAAYDDLSRYAITPSVFIADRLPGDVKALVGA